MIQQYICFKVQFAPSIKMILALQWVDQYFTV